MTWLAIKIAIRFVVFGAVFGIAAWRSEKITIKPRFAFPLVVLVFAALNIGLYWLLKPILNLATFGSLALVMPLVLNGAFLYLTTRVLRPLRIDGLWTMVKLAALLTAAHGALWVGLDYIDW